MNAVVAVMLGGAFGSGARYLLAELVHRQFGRGLPWGTLTVNVIGSLLIGVLAALLVERPVTSDVPRLFGIVGVLGGFTTFSSFSLETLQLLEQGALVRALGYVLASVVVCVTCTWLGLTLVRQLG
jgi:CrcB protein